MNVERVTWRHRNDFSAVMRCEHCNHTQEDRGMYADDFYIEQVIPARHYCGACGLNSLGELSPARAIGVRSTKTEGLGPEGEERGPAGTRPEDRS